MTITNEFDAYHAIRRSIVGGMLPSGHRLVEVDLAQDLKSSRSYVRAALVRLEFEGLVEKEPGRSAVVRRVPRSELLEIIEARVALEAIMARAAATRRTEPQAQRILHILHELVEAGTRSDISGLLQAQANFHHAVLDASRQPAIQRVVHTLAALTAQTRMRSTLLPGRIQTSIKEHRAIATAIVAQDSDAAEQAMVQHIRSVGQAISQLSDSVLHNSISTAQLPSHQSFTPKEIAI